MRSRLRQLSRNKFGGSRQVITVVPYGDKPHMAKLGAYDIKYGNLIPAFDNVDVTIGKNGFIEENKKREGDKRTPEGSYPVEFAFGYARFVKTAMPYSQADKENYWIDDPCSPRYNSWVTGRPACISSEKMKRKDHLYKLGFVIGHNRPYPKRGRGSAIFFHVWRRPGCCSCGCVAMAEEDLRSILSWLKPAKKPTVALGDRVINSLCGFEVAP